MQRNIRLRFTSFRPVNQQANLRLGKLHWLRLLSTTLSRRSQNGEKQVCKRRRAKIPWGEKIR